MAELRRRIRSHRDLDVWPKSMALVEEAYQIAATLPKSETYGLAAQIRRSAVSIPANIAEGRGRGTRREYHYHVTVSYGSLMELETEVQLTARLGFVEQLRVDAFLEAGAVVGRELNGLKRSLQPRHPAPGP